MVVLSLVGGRRLSAAEPGLTEPELLVRLLSGPTVLAVRQAAEATGEATATRSPTLPNPTVGFRHEEARGPAGASTDIMGGALTLDLGFAAVAEARAAALRVQAAEHRRHAAVLGEVCALRGAILDRWVAAEALAVVEATQGRLDRMARGLDTLADRGEVSAYDRDRVGLDVQAHSPTVVAARRALSTHQAQLDAHLGSEAPPVELSLLGALPERAALLEQALGEQPTLRALRVEEQAAQVTEGAARRSSLPDLEIAGGLRWDAPPTGGAATAGFEVGGTLEVPIFHQGQSAIRWATADRAAVSAERLQTEAAVRAQVEGAWTQAHATASPPMQVDTEALWRGAEQRYGAGEGSIDELLQVALAIEVAQLAVVDWHHQHRRARLDLSCAVGRFDEPPIQSILEDVLR